MRRIKHLGRKRVSILALNLAILLVVAGGTAAFGVFSKTVTLSVDGHSQTVRTFGERVDDVLAAKGISLEPADRVSPAVAAVVPDGGTIKVDYARPMTFSVDGVTQTHLLFHPSVKRAMAKFKVDPKPGAYMSAEPDQTIPRSGMHLVVSNLKKVKVVADGKTKKITTNAPTVGEVLEKAGVELTPEDEVKPGADALVTTDAALKVVRIKTETKTEVIKLKYGVEVQKDDSMLKGKVKVVDPGKAGEKREKVTVTYANGKVRHREVLASEVVSDPITQVEKHGTATPPEAPSVTGNSVWDKIAQCESGGNWSINTGNGYYGGLQFSAATWHSVGGSGLPSSHSRDEQIKRAKILQARSGWGQWGCAPARFN